MIISDSTGRIKNTTRYVFPVRVALSRRVGRRQEHFEGKRPEVIKPALYIRHHSLYHEKISLIC